MVAINPYDPRSVDEASEMIDLAQVSVLINHVVYRFWLRAKDVDVVSARMREFTDRALRDLKEDLGHFLSSLELSEGDGDEMQTRQCLFLYWIGLPRIRRNHEILENEFQSAVEEALTKLG